MREFDLTTKTFVANGFKTPEAKTGTTWVDDSTLLVGVSYERPRPGVATCVRLSIPYLVLSIDRATLGGPLPTRVEVQANARS